MTIEKRFEFLFQSIASHDQQLGELAEKVAALTENQAETGRQMKETDRQMKEIFAQMDVRDAAVQVKFDMLAQAMLGLTEHAANHAERIERLEG